MRTSLTLKATTSQGVSKGRCLTPANTMRGSTSPWSHPEKPRHVQRGQGCPCCSGGRRQQQGRNPAASSEEQKPLLSEDLGTWFVTTVICNSSHPGTTGEGQLCLATSGMLATPASGGKTSSPLSLSEPPTPNPPAL